MPDYNVIIERQTTRRIALHLGAASEYEAEQAAEHMVIAYGLDALERDWRTTAEHDDWSITEVEHDS